MRDIASDRRIFLTLSSAAALLRQRVWIVVLMLEDLCVCELVYGDSEAR